MLVHGIDLGDQLLAAAQELGQLLVLEVAAWCSGTASAAGAGHRLRQGAAGRTHLHQPAAARAGSCCCLATSPRPWGLRLWEWGARPQSHDLEPLLAMQAETLKIRPVFAHKHPRQLQYRFECQLLQSIRMYANA